MDNNRRRAERPGLFAQSFQVFPYQYRRQPRLRLSRVLEGFDSGSERDRREQRRGFPPPIEHVKELISLYIAQGRGRGAYVVAKKREWEEHHAYEISRRRPSLRDPRRRYGRDSSSSSDDSSGGAPGKPKPHIPTPSGPPRPAPVRFDGSVQFDGPGPSARPDDLIPPASRFQRTRESQISVLRHADLRDQREFQAQQFEEQETQEQAREHSQVHIPDYARMAPGQAPTRIINARPDVSGRGGALEIDPLESRDPKHLQLVFPWSNAMSKTLTLKVYTSSTRKKEECYLATSQSTIRLTATTIATGKISGLWIGSRIITAALKGDIQVYLVKFSL